MRLDGIGGKGSGKKGNSVFYVNHGVQIEREYTSHVSNPSTANQVTQRSRFKLASQVSAVLEPSIVIPRKGIQSPRNLFVKKNMGYFYGSTDGAQVSYENLQLTGGAVGLPEIVLQRLTPDELDVALAASVNNLVSHVVWDIYQKTDDGLVRWKDSKVVEVKAGTLNGDATFTDMEGSLVVYAYGIKARNAKALAKFGNYQVEDARDIAKLVANRTIEVKDYMFTATRGTSLGEGASQNTIPDEGEALVYLSAFNGGEIKVTQEGESPINITNAVFSVGLGDGITLEAVTPNDFEFKGWYYNGAQQPFSRQSPITLTVSAMLDIVAVFSYVGGGGLE